MKLSTLLGPDQIILEMKAGGHWDSILELVNHLVNGGFLPPSLRDECLTAFKTREDQVSTGIGYGVAIPHVFSDHIDHVIAVFGRSRVGIDFEALDNAPVHYIILFLVPRKDYQLHMRTLAAIAKLFNNSDIRRQMSAATTRDEILAILDARPAPSHSSIS